jgi:hypothetical protein
VYEFDLPPECDRVDLNVDACHPKSVVLEFDVWHSEK